MKPTHRVTFAVTTTLSFDVDAGDPHDDAEAVRIARELYKSGTDASVTTGPDYEVDDVETLLTDAEWLGVSQDAMEPDECEGES